MVVCGLSLDSVARGDSSGISDLLEVGERILRDLFERMEDLSRYPCPEERGG
jgi:hypothetical protein